MSPKVNCDHSFYLSHKDEMTSCFIYPQPVIEQIYTAIYVRVSTEKQVIHGTSLGDQINDCLERAKELEIPVEYIKLYIEGGQSGEDIERPEMNRLREDVENGFIKNVIIRHPDRFSREMNGKLQVCAEFERNEVELIFTDYEYSNTAEGKLFFNVLSAISQYELEQIKKRTRRGTRKAVKELKRIQPMRTPPFGYKLVDGKFEVIDEEAKYIPAIYQMYIDGMSMREIGEWLYLEGVRPKRGESDQWNASSIARVLKNENYIGKYYYNRRKTKKVKGERTKQGKPRREYSFREETDWWLIDDPKVVPPLIDLQLFFEAQATRLANTYEKGQTKNEYLLARLLHCKCCNVKFSPYTSTSQQTAKKTGITSKWHYRRYRCQNKNPRKYGGEVNKCPLPVLYADLIEDYIWKNYVLNTLCDVDLLEKKLTEKEEGVGSNPKVDELVRYQKKMQNIDEEKKRVQFSFQKGWSSPEDTDKEMKRLMAEENHLKLKINELESSINTNVNLKLSKEKILNTAKKIADLLDGGYELPFEVKQNIVRLLISEIVVSEGKKEKEFVLEIHGVLNEEKIATTTESIKDSLDSKDDKTLRYSRTQPQGVVNKDNAVKNEKKNNEKSFVFNAYTKQLAYIEFVSELSFYSKGKGKTKMKSRKKKFEIN